jgi:hypothetical protein
MERTLVGVGVCMIAVLAPWWVAFLAAGIVALYYGYAPEFIIIGFIIDALHAQTGTGWSLAHLVYTLGGTLLFIGSFILKRMIFVRARL